MGSGTFSSGGNITTTGNISTTAGGTITSNGLLTASNGLTVSSGVVTLPLGTVSAPSLTFNGHSGDGLYFDASSSSPSLVSGGSDRFVIYHLKTPLTNNVAASIIRISGLGSNGVAGANVDFLLTATDAGGNNQSMAGTAWFACQQTTGTVSANVAVSESVAVGSGTLAVSWSAVTGVAGQCDLQLTPSSSLTTTLIQISMNVVALNNSTSNTITFL